MKIVCVEDVLHPIPYMSSSKVPKNIDATRVSIKTQQVHKQIVNYTQIKTPIHH